MARIRILFEKKGLITFLNHMELPTLFSRAARRAGLSQEFTQGFSPHPRISLGPSLAAGVEGNAEVAEFWFNEWKDGYAVYWNDKMPEGLRILKCAEVDGPSLAKLANAAAYRIYGTTFELGCEAMKVLEEEVKNSGELHGISLESGCIKLMVGDLDHCGAGSLVRALKENGICGGWTDLYLVRESVGVWDPELSEICGLI